MRALEAVMVLWGGRERLSSRRGVGASLGASLLFVAAVSGSRNPGSAAVALIVCSPLIWWAGWWLTGVLAGVWEGLVAGAPPEVSVGRAWQSTSTRKQLRQDANARVFSDRGGILLRRRFWFVASGAPLFRLEPESYAGMAEAQETDPVELAAYRDRIYWWYRDEFYWTNAEYASHDIKALLFARERQRERELEHAHAVMAAVASPAARQRTSIPRDVKHAVWKRDAGSCIECGSDFEIQYDHIIPFSMGGANTVENLQLLCARCNQQKGGRL